MVEFNFFCFFCIEVFTAEVTEGGEIRLRLDADFADYADLFAGLDALGLAGLDVNIRQSQYLRPRAISTNGRQKLLKPAKDRLGSVLGDFFGFTGAVYQNRLAPAQAGISLRSAVKIAGFLLCEHKRSLQLRLSSGGAAGVKPKGSR